MNTFLHVDYDPTVHVHANAPLTGTTRIVLAGLRDPAGILAALGGPLAPGSYLVISHATGDFGPQAAGDAAAVYDQATSPVTLRTRDQVTALFTGWDLIDPGVVQVLLWHPGGRPPRAKELARAWIYGGAARKNQSPGLCAVFRSTSRLCAISLLLRPACQWTKISTMPATSNVLLAIGPPAPNVRVGRNAPASVWPGPARHARVPHGNYVIGLGNYVIVNGPPPGIS